MKKVFLMMVLMVCCMLFAGCSGAAADGDMKVNTKERQVYVNNTAYTYDIQDDALRITYPNGVVYVQEHYSSGDASGYASGYSGEIGEDDPDGAYLAEAILKSQQKNIVPYLIIGVIGIFLALEPGVVWKVTYGWMFKKAEPSRGVLIYIRIIGVIVIVGSLILALM
jgi:hypothetical protein